MQIQISRLTQQEIEEQRTKSERGIVRNKLYKKCSLNNTGAHQPYDPLPSHGFMASVLSSGPANNGYL